MLWYGSASLGVNCYRQDTLRIAPPTSPQYRLKMLARARGIMAVRVKIKVGLLLCGPVSASVVIRLSR